MFPYDMTIIYTLHAYVQYVTRWVRPIPARPTADVRVLTVRCMLYYNNIMSYQNDID